MNSITTISATDLTTLGATEAVLIFRDLLWCQARRRNVPTTKIHVTAAVNVPDGGVDAEVASDALNAADDALVAGNTFYQIKAGTSSTPWQESWVRKELLGGAPGPEAQHLGAAVRRCLEQRGRYVLVCFGCDPTGEQLKQARAHVKTAFARCGFPAARVEVWGQSHLVGLISPYPSLCLRLTRRSDLEFQTVSEWQLDANMSPALQIAEPQRRFVDEVRRHLRGGATPHVRVIGEPGLGKTRLVLEAVSADDLAPLVVYMPHAEDFQKSHLLRELLRADNDFVVVLVVDECPSKEMASIWSALRNRSDRVRLVTIDHGPEDASDDRMAVVNCPALPREQIAAVINWYIDSEFDASRWAEFCEGSPRVAHAVGQNLKCNPEDILKPPATVPMWDRFVSGYGAADSPSVVRRLIVLRHVALFQKFGFESPVGAEAEFVFELARRADAQLTWPTFQSIVHDLKQRRILQGKTTLFIVPKALHVYLWLQFWEQHGRGFDLKGVLGRVPESLRHWFIEMFPYAHASRVAAGQVDALLGRGGPFDDEAFVDSRAGGAFLNVLTEASPKATLACIERAVARKDREGLLQFKEGRQYLVWALEKIAVWPDCFHRASAVLLRLADAENGSTANNATGTFVGLFSLAYGPLASTETPPAQRLPALRAALESGSRTERAVGLKACAHALAFDHYSRMIGPEHQGLRPTAKLWTPRLWKDLFDAYREVWELLVKVRSGWDGDERRQAADVLIKAAGGLIQVKPLAKMALDTVEALLGDTTTDLREVVGLVTRSLRIHKDLPASTVSRLKKLDRKVTGRSFASRLRRVVLLGNWDDDYGGDGKRSGQHQRRVEALADEAVARPRVVRPLLPELVSTEGYGLPAFGFALAERDAKHALLPDIVAAYRAAGDSTNPILLASYLVSLFHRDRPAWERTVLALLDDEKLGTSVAPLIPRSGLTAAVLDRLLHEMDGGRFGVSALRPLAYVHDPDVLDAGRWDEVIERLLAEGDEDAGEALVEIAHRLYGDANTRRPLPEGLGLRLLTAPHTLMCERNSMREYYWHELAKAYVEQHPGRGIDLFRHVLGRCRDWQFELALLHSQVNELLFGIVKRYPAECWVVVAALLEKAEQSDTSVLRHWLAPRTSFGADCVPGPLSLFPEDLVLAWVAARPEERAPFLARTVNKTLDLSNGGRLAREMLVRFGHVDHVENNMWCHFWSDGYCGRASEHYRRKRDVVRSWLAGERDPRIVGWLERYIEGLGKDIDAAEIKEEREF